MLMPLLPKVSTAGHDRASGDEGPGISMKNRSSLRVVAGGLVLVSFLVALLSPASAGAQGCQDYTFTANGLLCLCEEQPQLGEGENILNKTLCSGFIAGVVEEGAGTWRTARTACLPNDLRLADGRLLIIQYMRDHPEVRRARSHRVIAAAMAETYPLPTTGAALGFTSFLKRAWQQELHTTL